MNAPNTLRTRYPVLRSVVREDLATLDDYALASSIAESLPGVSADELEINFRKIGRSIGRGLGQAGNVLGRAAPGAITGAMQGATMGAALGPYGMLAGAALGAVGGGIASYQQSRQSGRPAQGAPPQTSPTAQSRRQPPPGPQRSVPQQPQSRATAARTVPAINAPPSATPQVGPASTATPGQSAAAGQLLQLLARPEVLQALLSLAMGAAGRQRIRVGEHIVAPVQMLNAVELVASGMPLDADSRGSAEADPFDAIGVSEAILSELSRTTPESSDFHRAVEMTASRDGFDGEEEESYPDWNPSADDAWPPGVGSPQFGMERA